MSTHQKQKVEGNPDGIIRIFRALVLVALSFGVGYFVYTTTVHPDSKYPFKLGLDLAGGSHLVYEADVSTLDPAEVPELMSVLREVIERRVNAFGVSEPVVQVERSSSVAETQAERLIVELPGVANVEDAVREIGKTPLLEFKLVGAPVGSSTEATFIETGLTGRYLKGAELVFGQGNGGGLSNEPIVSITFNEEGATLFEQVTRDHVSEQLAIFLDGEMMSSPVINEAIGGGKAIISGNFTPEDARELVRNLNFGALPMPITLVSTQTVGASLGERAVDAGIFSGILGLGAIALFMTLWYRLPGLVSALSLITYVCIMLAIFKLIPVTLTAAGLAGLVLSIGLAVDANILISERMKEELRAGKKAREASEEGFSQAWSSIRDGNLVNILSGIILYWFGDVFIEGFAFTLIIGTIVSLLSSLIISRTFLLAISMKGDVGVSRFLMGSGIHK
jgi:preprotein translocase subunit SecD